MAIGRSDEEVASTDVASLRRVAHSPYRPDIDGLRAIAVLAVLGFHLVPALVPGGFVGVDIFFVISGYLISTIIINEVASGTFSFIDFYARRARRILPALMSVSAVAIVFYTQVFYSPQILRAFQSLIASFLLTRTSTFTQRPIILVRRSTSYRSSTIGPSVSKNNTTSPSHFSYYSLAGFHGEVRFSPTVL
jgi:peptidoglycan/LPS O-acetylase OafA/YrhL